MSDSLRPPWTVAHQAPLSMEFFRHEYWNGLPFPSPGDLPDPGIEHALIIAMTVIAVMVVVVMMMGGGDDNVDDNEDWLAPSNLQQQATFKNSHL